MSLIFNQPAANSPGALLLAEQGGVCARCGGPYPCEVVQGPAGRRLLCPACFLKVPSVQGRIAALALRRGDPIHRYVKWQAYERDGRRCQVCRDPLAPTEAHVAAIDRRLVPELENVRTLCGACARTLPVRSRVRPRPPRPEVQPPPPPPAAPAPEPEPGGRHLAFSEIRRRLFASSGGRCGLCSGLISQRVARLLRLNRSGTPALTDGLVVCPDCRAGRLPLALWPQNQLPMAPAAVGQFARLTGVSVSQAQAIARRVVGMATLEHYRRQGSDRTYLYEGLRLHLTDGEVDEVQATPGWSALRWPGQRGLRRRYLERQANPRFDLVTLRLPVEVLERVHSMAKQDGPGWSLELWLVQLLGQASASSGRRGSV